ncbi:2-dehydropantoate 2-reductase [Acidimicrobiia bacterium EGI L10123]|uniref:2-dehydropantoate 2-reductase n=1 Tax=Salinilacustrithrix flava TaxID=2957203 RepID=UPI003D7C2700|nr:2-dehydropantoate 2-reductase [Acidimicrobiia bacterium EGI L10123]
MTTDPDGRRSYTIVGAGAVGLLYGTRLAVAGHPVRWLVRSGADTIAAEGIEVLSEGRRLRIEPADVVVASEPGALPASDVVVVATKTTANGRLGELLSGAGVPGATIAVFQNGLGAEEVVRAQVPGVGAVLGGLCFVCAHRHGPGRAEHLDYGAVTLAPLEVEHLPAADGVAADLRRAGVETAVLGDLGVARWRKLVWNIPFNGLCTLLDASTETLLADAAARALVADLMDEVIAGARAGGHDVPGAFRDEMLAATDAMRPYDPSMKLDLAAGRPLEIDAIYEVAIRTAREAGVPMPRTEALAAMLRFRDRPVPLPPT